MKCDDPSVVGEWFRVTGNYSDGTQVVVALFRDRGDAERYVEWLAASRICGGGEA